MPKVTIAHYAIDLGGAIFNSVPPYCLEGNYIKTQTLDRAGKGELRALTWLYDQASDITYQHAYDPAKMKVKVSVSGQLGEKDYTYYILKYGHLHSISS